MKWARVEPFKQEWDSDTKDTVMEVITISPIGRYVPEIVWHECPDDVQQYWVRDAETGEYIPNEPVPMPDPVEERLANLEQQNADLMSAIAELSIMMMGGYEDV